MSLQEEVTRCRVSRPTVYQRFNWSERAKQAENKIRDATQGSRSSCADTDMQNPTAACEDPLSLTHARACMWGGTAKLFLHSFYWQLLLKVTHISRGAEFQEKKKKARFLCNSSLELAGAQESCSSDRKLGHHSHTHSLTHVHKTACTQSHCPLLGPGWSAGETPWKKVYNKQPNGLKDREGRERILLCWDSRLP